jgi:hypothetical protein
MGMKSDAVWSMKWEWEKILWLLLDVAGSSLTRKRCGKSDIQCVKIDFTRKYISPSTTSITKASLGEPGTLASSAPRTIE